MNLQGLIDTVGGYSTSNTTSTTTNAAGSPAANATKSTNTKYWVFGAIAILLLIGALIFAFSGKDKTKKEDKPKE